MNAWRCRAQSRGTPISTTAPCTIIRRGPGSKCSWSVGSAAPAIAPANRYWTRRIKLLSILIELLSEISDRLGVDLRRIPLQQHLEIGGAFAPGLATLPAIAFEVIGGRSERVGRIVNEIAANRIFQIGRRQELGLADFAGPGAAHLGRVHVAAFDNLQRGDQFAAEFVRPAAIVSERRQRADGRIMPAVGAKIRFHSPDRNQHRAGHAILLLDTAERGGILQHHPPAAPHPRRHHAPRELVEALPEYALGVIAGDDARIVAHAAQRRLDRRLRNAFAGGLLLYALQPT